MIEFVTAESMFNTTNRARGRARATAPPEPLRGGGRGRSHTELKKGAARPGQARPQPLRQVQQDQAGVAASAYYPGGGGSLEVLGLHAHRGVRPHRVGEAQGHHRRLDVAPGSCI